MSQFVYSPRISGMENLRNHDYINQDSQQEDTIIWNDDQYYIKFTYLYINNIDNNENIENIENNIVLNDSDNMI
uniref:Uncharacterized protein n=1 Tax=Megaviridae environmental sample TaxID=1737588 RepID=A0A5J6VIX8_9VIRU|nr:MAG: hypothetical protein [Megaviridae environmental sample]